MTGSKNLTGQPDRGNPACHPVDKMGAIQPHAGTLLDLRRFFRILAHSEIDGIVLILHSSHNYTKSPERQHTRVSTVRLTGQISGTGHKPPEPVKPIKCHRYDIGSLQVVK